MMATCLSIVLHIAGDVCSHQFVNITTAATYNLYIMALKNILRALTHITGEHNLHALLAEHKHNTRLASASLRGRQNLLHLHNPAIDGKNCIVVTMSEVIVDHTILCWYSYFHINVCCAAHAARKKSILFKRDNLAEILAHLLALGLRCITERND